MTPVVLALHVAIAQPIALTYANVPPEAARVVVYEWRLPSEPVVTRFAIDRSNQLVVIRGTAGVSVIVVFEHSDGSYLLDGPFSWPLTDAIRTLEPQVYRTVRGTVPKDDEGEVPIQWIGSRPARGAWPACFRNGRSRWACWGVVVEEPGLVVVAEASRIVWSRVDRAGPGPFRVARWGRLVIVSERGAPASNVKVTFARPIPASAERMRAIRLETGPVTGAAATPMVAGVTWLSGNDVPPKAWAELRTERSGPGYVLLQDVAEGGAATPLHVSLAERRVLDGRVVGPKSEIAAQALVSVFRLIDPPPTDGSRTLPRRVLAAETVAAETGVFTIAELGEAEYEVVAWHPQLGRASVYLAPAERDLVLRLRSSGVVRGRVLAAGKPVHGVNVTSVPDAATFRGAEDMTDVKGGDTRTDVTGRFSVMVAPSGGGELRIGGGEYAVKRIPLPRPPGTSLDIGDIDLGTAIELMVVLDRDPGCQVRAAGPLGVTGLHLVFGVRKGEATYTMALPEPGLWQFDLVCADGRRPLEPSFMRVQQTDGTKALRFVVK